MGIFKKSKSFWLCQITAPEVKILLIFIYQLIFSAMLWSNITYQISKQNETHIAIKMYLRCLINGFQEHLDCEPYRREFEGLSIQGLIVSYVLLVPFLNISNLPLIIEYKSLKNVTQRWLRSLLSQTERE